VILALPCVAILVFAWIISPGAGLIATALLLYLALIGHLKWRRFAQRSTPGRSTSTTRSSSAPSSSTRATTASRPSGSRKERNWSPAATRSASCTKASDSRKASDVMTVKSW